MFEKCEIAFHAIRKPNAWDFIICLFIFWGDRYKKTPDFYYEIQIASRIIFKWDLLKH